MIKPIQNIPSDIDQLHQFISGAGSSLDTFRYFNNRPYQVISTHLYTMLLLDQSGTPVGYGHLDPEGEVVWLGICISETAAGNGFGKKVMEALVSEAEKRGIREILLKVDEANERAVKLYRKFMFEAVEHSPGKYYIMRRIADAG